MLGIKTAVSFNLTIPSCVSFGLTGGCVSSHERDTSEPGAPGESSGRAGKEPGLVLPDL